MLRKEKIFRFLLNSTVSSRIHIMSIRQAQTLLNRRNSSAILEREEAATLKNISLFPIATEPILSALGTFLMKEYRSVKH